MVVVATKAKEENVLANILLVSLDENSYQPLGIACVSSALKGGWHAVKMIDGSIQSFNFKEECKNLNLIAISIPVFGALWKTMSFIRELRLYTDTPLFVYNQYASFNQTLFKKFPKCYVLPGDYETLLLKIADYIDKKEDYLRLIENKMPNAWLKENTFFVPDRSNLPPLRSYEKFRSKITGNVELMRGCAHKCTYCSVAACYNGQTKSTPIDIIAADIAQVYALGAKHITFVDADHFSIGAKGLKIIEDLKRTHSDLVFDLTVRADDIVKYANTISNYKNLGCIEMTVAMEFPKEEVLAAINKKMKIDTLYKAVNILNKNDIDIRPTFIVFNPWVTYEEIVGFDDFLKKIGLLNCVDELQKQTRLLLFKGSPLLMQEDIKQLITKEHETYYEWLHPDPRVEELYYGKTKNNDMTRVKCCIKG